MIYRKKIKMLNLQVFGRERIHNLPDVSFEGSYVFSDCTSMNNERMWLSEEGKLNYAIDV